MMRWSLLLLCLLASLGRAGAPVYVPIGPLKYATMPRDRALEGTALTDWGPDIKGAWHDCGLLWGNCNNAWYLLPVNSTDKSYIENGKTYTIYKTSDPQIGVVYEVRELNTATWVPAVGTYKYEIFKGNSARYYESRVRVKLVYIYGHSQAGTMSHTVNRSVMIGSVMTNAGGDGPEDYYLDNSTFNLTATTCSISSNAKVSLGNIRESDMSVVGAKSQEVPFSLSYNCPENISVNAFLTDLLYQQNKSDYLWMKKDVAGAAEGLMIAISAQHPQTGQKIIFSMSDTDKKNILQSKPVPLQGEVQMYAQVVTMSIPKPGNMNALLGITFTYE